MRSPRSGIDRTLLGLTEELIDELDLARMRERLRGALPLLFDCNEFWIGEVEPGLPIAASLTDAERLSFTLPLDGDRVLQVRLRSDGSDVRFERDLIERAHPLFVRLWTVAVELTALRRRLNSGAEDDGGPLLAAALRGQRLTVRQAEVLVTVAHGRSNRDTAKSLGLSERTVQKHLEHCYRTLGVTGRSQASELVWSLARRRATDHRDPPPQPRSG
jgi:DNA-binding CsgD family transcriptional regulator